MISGISEESDVDLETLILRFVKAGAIYFSKSSCMVKKVYQNSLLTSLCSLLAISAN